MAPSKSSRVANTIEDHTTDVMRNTKRKHESSNSRASRSKRRKPSFDEDLGVKGQPQSDINEDGLHQLPDLGSDMSLPLEKSTHTGSSHVRFGSQEPVTNVASLATPEVEENKTVEVARESSDDDAPEDLSARAARAKAQSSALAAAKAITQYVHDIQ